MNQIEIKIHKDGRIDLNLSNFDYDGGLEASRTIEYLLGNEIVNLQYAGDGLTATIPANKTVANEQN
ncbi:MAG: hypothetical protein JXR80_02230 [Deltaproteobacteria bacterium]|nr:hypothetical protein [Deltaproteobacteria bacterium]